MPYVSQERRKELHAEDAAFIDPAEVAGLASGDMNFLITRLCYAWWKANPRYSRIAEITGVLENVKQEFYRRVAVPYEDLKIAENGDVY